MPGQYIEASFSQLLADASNGGSDLVRRAYNNVFGNELYEELSVDQKLKIVTIMVDASSKEFTTAVLTVGLQHVASAISVVGAAIDSHIHTDND